MKSLFVGNLNFQTTEADLTALFQPFGQVGRIQKPRRQEQNARLEAEADLRFREQHGTFHGSPR